MSRPQVNWNNASNGAIRTSLRGSRISSGSQPSTPVTAEITQTPSNGAESTSISGGIERGISLQDAEPQSACDHALGPPLDEAVDQTHQQQLNKDLYQPVLQHQREIPQDHRSASQEATSMDHLKLMNMEPIATSSDEGEIMVNIVEAQPSSKDDTVPVQEACRLYLSSVARTATESDIHALFNGYRLTKVRIIESFGRPTNEVHVDMASMAEAQRAAKELDGRELNGLILSITLAAVEPSQHGVQSSKHHSAYSPVAASAKASQVSSRNGSVLQLPSAAENSPDSGSEDGELNEDGEASSSHELVSAPNLSETDDKSHSEEGEIIEIDSDVDPMITEYSDAKRPLKQPDISKIDSLVEVIDLEAPDERERASNDTTDGSITGPQTLAELTLAQLEVQVRYFYISRDPTTIPETDPVRCTVCAGVGHISPWCPAQTCSHCQAKGEHFSRKCPKITRCSRCRGQHTLSECKLKLKPENLTLHCDWCQEIGHIEADCELNWRSSGALWKNKLPPLSVARTCFLCGGSGHLGNDCSRRRPGSAMGSSMWSNKGLPNPITPLTSSMKEPITMPTISKKAKSKMPNPKAKGNAAASSKPTGAVQPVPSFNAISREGGKPLSNKAKIKGPPGKPHIQIKGLAARTGLNGPPQSQPRDYYEGSRQSYNNVPPPSHNQQPDNRYGDSYPRGRAGDGRRSRSRSPVGRYNRVPPPRAGGYGPPRGDYRDRDDPGYSNNRGPNSYRPGHR